MPGLQKWALNILSDPTSPEVLVSGVVLALLLWLSWRINSLVNDARAAINEARKKEDEQNRRIAALEKQLKKAIVVTNRQPCVGKQSSLWLIDENSVTDIPPEDIICLWEGRSDYDD